MRGRVLGKALGAAVGPVARPGKQHLARIQRLEFGQRQPLLAAAAFGVEQHGLVVHGLDPQQQPAAFQLQQGGQQLRRDIAQRHALHARMQAGATQRAWRQR
ncbi:hypothetical protein D3C85_1666720 [compost metagenome]